MARIVAQRNYWLLIEACELLQNLDKLEEDLREHAGVGPAQAVLITSRHVSPSIHTSFSHKWRPILASSIPVHSGTLSSIGFIFNVFLDHLTEHFGSAVRFSPRRLASQDHMYHHFVFYWALVLS